MSTYPSEPTHDIAPWIRMVADHPGIDNEIKHLIFFNLENFGAHYMLHHKNNEDILRRPPEQLTPYDAINYSLVWEYTREGHPFWNRLAYDKEPVEPRVPTIHTRLKLIFPLETHRDELRCARVAADEQGVTNKVVPFHEYSDRKVIDTFTWDETPQGFDYWHDIAHTLRKTPYPQAPSIQAQKQQNAWDLALELMNGAAP